MLSGRINGTVSLNSAYFSFYIDWAVTNTQANRVATNRSTVRARVYLQTTSTSRQFDTVAIRDHWVKIDGNEDAWSARINCNPWPSNPYLLREFSQSVEHDANGNKSLNISAYVNALASSFGPSDCNASATVVLDQIIQAPAAPTNAAVTRVSDTQQNISWARNATVVAPYENLRLQRWDNVTQAYYDLVILPGTATGYSDTTTQADRNYVYRVRAENATGNSAYAATSNVYTTPRTPTSQAAVRVGQDIVISWVNSSTIAQITRLQHQVDGGGYSDLIELAGNSQGYTHVVPGAGIHQYRVRTEASPLASSYVTTTEVQTLSPPNSPTGLTPNGVVFDATASRFFLWNHNTVDGTTQIAYELRYREQGEVDWVATGKIETTIQLRNVNADTFDNGKEYEWQVRTWGQHEDAGDWSASAAFTTSAKPVTIVTYPASDNDEHTNPDLIVEWQYSDAEMTNQTAYIVRLYSAADVILHSYQGVGTAESYAIPYALQDDTSYKIGVQVRDGDGLWSIETVRLFNVAYEPPITPGIDAAFNPVTASVTIQIFNNEDELAGETPETLHNRVYRKVDDGQLVLIADEIPLNGIVIDYVPGINNINTYVVVAVSDIGSLAISEEEQVLIGVKNEYWLNSGGPSYSDGVRLLLDVQMQDTYGRDTVVHKFAGREYGVSFQDEDGKEQNVFLSALVAVGDAAQLKKIIETNYGPVMYRDYFGRRFLAAVQLPSVRKEIHGKYYRFICTLIRVEGEV